MSVLRRGLNEHGIAKRARAPSPVAVVLKYWAVCMITVKTSLAYIADTLLRQVFLVVIIFAFAQLWLTTYRVTGQSSIAGFSVTEMLWYLVVTEAITMGQVRAAAAMDSDVKSGQITYTLLRPYSFIMYHYATYIGETLVRVPVNILLGGVVAALTVGMIQPAPASVLTGALSILLGPRFISLFRPRSGCLRSGLRRRSPSICCTAVLLCCWEE